jgi:hypothetical protein
MSLLEYNKKVIPFNSGDHCWTFLSVVTDSGRDVAVDWDIDRSFEALLAFGNFVKNDRKIKNPFEWTSWHHKMNGKPGKAGVIELRFTADKRQYRVLSVFNGSMRLVVLCICYHKGNVWSPKDAENIATERAKAVESGKAKLNVIEIGNYL